VSAFNARGSTKGNRSQSLISATRSESANRGESVPDPVTTTPCLPPPPATGERRAMAQGNSRKPTATRLPTFTATEAPYYLSSKAMKTFVGLRCWRMTNVDRCS
jgi:hypothetical protein